MGIIDRDYMNRDKSDKVKDSWYNPKAFRGGRSGGRGGGGLPPDWWEKNWIKDEPPTNEAPTKPWARPWLKHLFVWLLIGFAMHKAIEFSKANSARKAHERHFAQLQEQQRLQEMSREAGQTYKSPYARQPEPQRMAPIAPPVQAPLKPPSVIVRNGMTVLEASQDGHYFSSGTVNGFPVVFMVDTGATHVSISEDTAARAGISRCTPTTFETANGQGTGCKAIVPVVEFGGYVVSNVEVTITKGIRGHSLLGMNVLRLFKIQQNGSRLFFSPAS